MGKFLRGLLFGIGLGLLLAPMRGQDMRRLVSERFQKLRGYLPANEQLNQYTQQISDRATQTASSLKDYTQQATAQVKDTAGNLGDVAQQARSTVTQMGKDVVETTKQGATQTRQSGQPTTASPAMSSQTPSSPVGTPSPGNPLSTIPGMEPEPQSRLEAQGIHTTRQLLEQTTTKEERADLAQRIGMTTHMLKTLVDRADLMQLQGVGADAATLLEEAGVMGCKDLQRRNPEHLHATLTQARASNKVASRTPELEQITQWVAEAMVVAHSTQE